MQRNARPLHVKLEPQLAKVVKARLVLLQMAKQQRLHQHQLRQLLAILPLIAVI